MTEHKAKKWIRVLSRIADDAVLLLLLIGLVFAAYALWDSHQVYAEADSAKYQTYKPTEDDMLSFEELRAMNHDVMGWLTIYGTKIDYPIVKAEKDNWEYLSKNAEGNWESSGALYVDCRNSKNFRDFNTIIHGHHMAGHAMFGDLDLFTDKKFFDEHQYANLFYNGTNHGIEIIAVLTIDAYNPIASSANITSDVGKQKLIDRIREEQLYGRDIEVTIKDHLVVMTTCNLGMTNGRYTLVGKILNRPVKDPFLGKSIKKGNQEGIDLVSVLDSFVKMDLWKWILLLILLIISTWGLYRAELRRVNREKQ